MPTASRMAPIIVEVKPSNVRSKSKIAPSSPGSPKAVRFAEDSIVSKQEARRLDPTEAWSLYHFETHARQCPECIHPLGVHRRGGRLCAIGHGLAQDVAEHIYYKEGELYSAKTDNQKHVRVEIEEGYDQVRQLLKSMDRALRATHRSAPPVISYDATYPISARPSSALEPVDQLPQQQAQKQQQQRRTETIIEPANSRHHRRSSRYSTITVENDNEPSTTSASRDERRGSLYAKDMQRQRREAYQVEIREPADEERRRRRRRRYESRKTEGYSL